VKPLILVLFGFSLMSAAVVSAQPNTPARRTPQRANQGRIPPPPRQSSGNDAEELGNGRVNNSQHVNHNHWYGHENADDPRFHLDRPFDHGYFDHGGREHPYNIFGVDWIHHRFELPGGYHFEVAPWEWTVFTTWCVNCGYDFVIYADPDHIGWYLLYNIYTGTYVHVRYVAHEF